MDKKKEFSKDDLDWRIQACTSLVKPFHDPSGIIHPTGTIIKVVKQIKYKKSIEIITLPNPSAMYLNIALDLAIESKELYKNFPKNFNPIKDEKLYDFFENRIACVILSYSSIETFSNLEIPLDYTYNAERNDKKCLKNYNHDQIQRYVMLDIKLDKILPQILNIRSPKPENNNDKEFCKIWNNYKWLKNLRDRFIHLKPSDWDSRNYENIDNNIWTELLKPKLEEAPFIAFRIIKHFDLKPSKHRWIEKFQEKFIK